MVTGSLSSVDTVIVDTGALLETSSSSRFEEMHALHLKMIEGYLRQVRASTAPIAASSGNCSEACDKDGTSISSVTEPSVPERIVRISHSASPLYSSLMIFLKSSSSLRAHSHRKRLQVGVGDPLRGSRHREWGRQDR